MASYTVNVTRRAIVEHEGRVLAAPLVMWTQELGWDWETDVITTWDPVLTGNMALALVDDATQALLPPFDAYRRWVYEEPLAVMEHLAELHARNLSSA